MLTDDIVLISYRSSHVYKLPWLGDENWFVPQWNHFKLIIVKRIISIIIIFNI